MIRDFNLKVLDKIVETTHVSLLVGFGPSSDLSTASVLLEVNSFQFTAEICIILQFALEVLEVGEYSSFQSLKLRLTSSGEQAGPQNRDKSRRKEGRGIQHE
jgi:hypothetical protein